MFGLKYYKGKLLQIIQNLVVGQVYPQYFVSDPVVVIIPQVSASNASLVSKLKTI